MALMMILILYYDKIKQTKHDSVNNFFDTISTQLQCCNKNSLKSNQITGVGALIDFFASLLNTN